MLQTPNQTPDTQLSRQYSQQFQSIIPYLTGSLESLSVVREALEHRLNVHVFVLFFHF